MKRLIAPSLVIALCGMAAARDQGPDTEITAHAVAKLNAKLGESEVKVDQVRVTDDGVACIDFHGTGSTSGKKGHAVVQASSCWSARTRTRMGSRMLGRSIVWGRGAGRHRRSSRA